MSEPSIQDGEALPVRGGSGEMFDRIARRYDLLNRLMSFGMDRRWRKKTVAALELGGGRSDLPGGCAVPLKSGAKTGGCEGEPVPVGASEIPRVLDLATGTGDLAIDVARRVPGVRVVGLDPSAGMLGIGREKVARRGLAGRIEMVVGDAQALEFEDGAFAGVTMGFGIRNVPDRGKALREMARVVRPGGRVAILELGTPRGGVMAPLARFHIQTVVPRMGALLSGAKEYRYLERSIAAFPPPEEFATLMRESGLEVVAVRSMSFGAVQLFVGTPARRAA